MVGRPTTSPLLPYTTLFRSRQPVASLGIRKVWHQKVRYWPGAGRREYRYQWRRCFFNDRSGASESEPQSGLHPDGRGTDAGEKSGGFTGDLAQQWAGGRRYRRARSEERRVEKG